MPADIPQAEEDNYHHQFNELYSGLTESISQYKQLYYFNKTLAKLENDADLFLKQNKLLTKQKLDDWSEKLAQTVAQDISQAQTEVEILKQKKQLVFEAFKKKEEECKALLTNKKLRARSS